MALDILFNTEQDVHNLMMSFNTDMLYEYETGNIDISGRLCIPTTKALSSKKVTVAGGAAEKLTLDNLFNGTARTTVLGNTSAPVISDTVSLKTNATYVEDGVIKPIFDFVAKKYSIGGALYVESVEEDKITLVQIVQKTQVEGSDEAEPIKVTINLDPAELPEKSDGTKMTTREFAESKFGVVFKNEEGYDLNDQGRGTSWPATMPDAFGVDEPLAGPEKLITNIRLIEPTEDVDTEYTDLDKNMKVSFFDVQLEAN